MTSFLLWLNRFDRDGDAVAVVELMRTNIGQVVDGDAEFSQGIADALGVPMTVREWSIGSFRTPFYSEYPTSDEWEDRYPEVWRITLTGDATGDAPVEPSLRPAPFDGFDSTWNPLNFDPPDPKAQGAVIGVSVGGAADDTLLDRIRAVRPGATIDTVVARSSRTLATRVTVHLGTVDFDSGTAAIDHLTAALRELGLAVTRRGVEAALTT